MQASHRIDSHPILPADTRGAIEFTWCGETFAARCGETIAAALFAHGIHIFGHHPKDGAPQGIFCANGQCAQCMVLANGRPVKACMTQVRSGMRVMPIEGLSQLPEPGTHRYTSQQIPVTDVQVLIIGGGPAGLSAAGELGQQGLTTLLIDDKDRLGGKLVLQTHRFFGSIEAVHAGTRGIDIARCLSDKVRAQASVEIWLNATALAVFSDGLVGVLCSDLTSETAGETYRLVKPAVLIVATGARERALVFPGNTLPGVYGAGAFQTMVNRDLVRVARKLFIVGGGNVGLIAGYHALQAGIEVVGLVEALPHCGGYKVHADKLARLGVPIYTSHTVASANGTDHVSSITIAQIDSGFTVVPGTERTFACDTVLIAVGLSPVDEFTAKAKAFGMTVFDAGDAQAIAEASAAMFTGRIAGREAAQALGRPVGIPDEWHQMADVLKSHPGAVLPRTQPTRQTGVFPVFHCTQEIPCNPCTAVCPNRLISIPGDDIRGLPVFTGVPGGTDCVGCGKCLAICPGLAITLVDARKDQALPTVSVAYELGAQLLQVGDVVTILDTEGSILGETPITGIQDNSRRDHTVIVQVQVPAAVAKSVAGIRLPRRRWDTQMPHAVEALPDDAIVCRCERVTAGEIRSWIRRGYGDLNELKAITRAGMGACGGKTCTALIERLFREEGIPMDEVTEGTHRPLFVEAPLSAFAGTLEDDGTREDAAMPETSDRPEMNDG